MSERLEDGTIVDGRYRLTGRLGTGGMADVHCAEDLQLGRRVALKLLHRRFADDEQFAERFRREASAAAGLQHQHVVSVYDRGEWDGLPYIAMELVEGRTLKQVVQQEAPLAPERAVDLTIQVLRAARFAHKRGIIHRDLKPHNVMVDREDRAKVTDFGIARAGASDMTETGSIMGTAQYLSPEQAQGLPVSAASDLYSVGVMLYELLTAQVPFDGDSAVSVALKQVSEPPVPPSRRVATIPPALEQVVLRALEKDPARRFADADEMIAALEAARGGSAAAGAIPPTSATVVAGGGLGAAGVAGAYAAADAPPTMMHPATGELPLASYESEHVAVAGGPPEDPDRNRWWIGLIAALVVVGLIVGALLLSGKDQVTVPDVIGAQQDAAEQRLRNEGLGSDATPRTSRQPVGTVLSQDPEPGAEADEGSTVRLVVSSGPGEAVVPDLRGQPRRAARQRLRQLGFKVAERRESDDEVGENRVIETVPAGGEELEKGQTVTLVVSRGPERVAVPDVRGRERDEAQSTLEDAGLRVSVREQESEDRDPGTVLSQDPSGGRRVPKGSSVTITVAKEPAEEEVPDVVGEDEADAVRELSGAGFEVRVREGDVSSPDDDGVVLQQEPSRGRLERGSTVTIVVGSFDPTQAPPTTTPTSPQGGSTTPEGAAP